MLILEDRQLFDDNWIYIHDPSVKVGRIQNFKSWSPEMVPDPKLCCYGLEYFCFEGDGLWTRSDAELIELAKRELEQIGLCPADQVFDGCVVRQPKAYPVYDGCYADKVEVLRAELRARFPNLHVVGRNGMHKYNNQDHSMMTAMLTVENILAGRELYDVWRVNEDAEYHEAGERGTQSSMSGLRDTPRAARVAP
jgi:protoporphyrinogen oxidase